MGVGTGPWEEGTWITANIMYLWKQITMGITITQYRAAIGQFGGGVLRDKWIFTFTHDKRFMFTCDWYECFGWGFRNRHEWSLLLCGNTASKQSPRCILSFYIGLSVFIQCLLLISGDIHPNPGPNWTDISICHANIRSIKNPSKLDHIACELADRYKIITFELNLAQEQH